ncbi:MULTISPECIES: hypothetical protein [Thermomonas]|jgi:hypothetical protein|uniref:hypothetical protein n=1 Tax=Thermomonas TaxID=141948 RepID=UPI000427D693|nr:MULTISPECIES: hypothetical protein [Thermomonas]
MRPALLLLLAALAVPASAQNAATATAPPAQPVNFTVPAAAAQDVASIDAIIKTLYAVISGPVGQARDWNRLRSLFVPDAKMMPVGVRADGGAGMRLLRVNDYVALSGPMLVERGFRETELARRTEQFGHIAHVFSTYEGKVEGGAAPMRGINSIQLMHDGQRWWIVSLMWEAENPKLALPAQYLPGAR